MLYDVSIVQVKNDLPRKWLSDDFFDLILWYDAEIIRGFQLCYDKPFAERALTWNETSGFIHTAIDAGEETPTANRTPLLTSLRPTENTFPRERVIAEFCRRGQMLPAAMRNFILKKLTAYSPNQS